MIRAVRWAIVGVLLSCCGDGGPVGSPPEAILVAPAYCDLGAEITLDGSGSSDPDHDLVVFRFVIADGSAVSESTARTVTHPCRVPGLIQVTLVVEDLQGNQDYASRVVSVRAP